MYRGVPAATTVAAIGLLAAGLDQARAVQLVTDQTSTHRQEDWNPVLGGDEELLETKQKLDQVEEQLNQM